MTDGDIFIIFQICRYVLLLFGVLLLAYASGISFRIKNSGDLSGLTEAGKKFINKPSQSAKAARSIDDILRGK